MLKQLAPIVVMPPSPKNSACKISAVLTPITAAHGPSTIAIKVPPTPFAVVPLGTGMLKVMDDSQARIGLARRFLLVPNLVAVQVDLEAALAHWGELNRQVLAKTCKHLGRHPGGRRQELSSDAVLDL